MENHIQSFEKKTDSYLYIRLCMYIHVHVYVHVDVHVHIRTLGIYKQMQYRYTLKP